MLRRQLLAVAGRNRARPACAVRGNAAAATTAADRLRALVISALNATRFQGGATFANVVGSLGDLFAVAASAPPPMPLGAPPFARRDTAGPLHLPGMSVHAAMLSTPNRLLLTRHATAVVSELSSVGIAQLLRGLSQLGMVDSVLRDHLRKNFVRRFRKEVAQWAEACELTPNGPHGVSPQLNEAMESARLSAAQRFIAWRATQGDFGFAHAVRDLAVGLRYLRVTRDDATLAAVLSDCMAPVAGVDAPRVGGERRAVASHGSALLELDAVATALIGSFSSLPAAVANDADSDATAAELLRILMLDSVPPSAAEVSAASNDKKPAAAGAIASPTVPSWAQQMAVEAAAAAAFPGYASDTVFAPDNAASNADLDPAPPPMYFTACVLIPSLIARADSSHTGSFVELSSALLTCLRTQQRNTTVARLLQASLLPQLSRRIAHSLADATASDVTVPRALQLCGIGITTAAAAVEPAARRGATSRELSGLVQSVLTTMLRCVLPRVHQLTADEIVRTVDVLAALEDFGATVDFGGPRPPPKSAAGRLRFLDVFTAMAAASGVVVDAEALAAWDRALTARLGRVSGDLRGGQLAVLLRAMQRLGPATLQLPIVRVFIRRLSAQCLPDLTARDAAAVLRALRALTEASVAAVPPAATTSPDLTEAAATAAPDAASFAPFIAQLVSEIASRFVPILCTDKEGVRLSFHDVALTTTHDSASPRGTAIPNATPSDFVHTVALAPGTLVAMADMLPPLAALLPRSQLTINLAAILFSNANRLLAAGGSHFSSNAPKDAIVPQKAEATACTGTEARGGFYSVCDGAEPTPQMGPQRPAALRVSAHYAALCECVLAVATYVTPQLGRPTLGGLHATAADEHLDAITEGAFAPFMLSAVAALNGETQALARQVLHIKSGVTNKPPPDSAAPMDECGADARAVLDALCVGARADHPFDFVCPAPASKPALHSLTPLLIHVGLLTTNGDDVFDSVAAAERERFLHLTLFMVRAFVEASSFGRCFDGSRRGTETILALKELVPALAGMVDAVGVMPSADLVGPAARLQAQALLARFVERQLSVLHRVIPPHAADDAVMAAASAMTDLATTFGLTSDVDDAFDPAAVLYELRGSGRVEGATPASAVGTLGRILVGCNGRLLRDLVALAARAAAIQLRRGTATGDATAVVDIPKLLELACAAQPALSRSPVALASTDTSSTLVLFALNAAKRSDTAACHGALLALLKTLRHLMQLFGSASTATPDVTATLMDLWTAMDIHMFANSEAMYGAAAATLQVTQAAADPALLSVVAAAAQRCQEGQRTALETALRTAALHHHGSVEKVHMPLPGPCEECLAALIRRHPALVTSSHAAAWLRRTELLRDQPEVVKAEIFGPTVAIAESAAAAPSNVSHEAAPDTIDVPSATESESTETVSNDLTPQFPKSPVEATPTDVAVAAPPVAGLEWLAFLDPATIAAAQAAAAARLQRPTQQRTNLPTDEPSHEALLSNGTESSDDHSSPIATELSGSPDTHVAPCDPLPAAVEGPLHIQATRGLENLTTTPGYAHMYEGGVFNPYAAPSASQQWDRGPGTPFGVPGDNSNEPPNRGAVYVAGGIATGIAWYSSMTRRH